MRGSVDLSDGGNPFLIKTIKLMLKNLEMQKLTAIPLGIAGWLRYMLGVDDEGEKYELGIQCEKRFQSKKEPMNEEIQEQLKEIVIGKPETFTDQLKPILSNERLFFVDLYITGVAEKIEEMFREMIAGKGAVRATIHKYVNQ